MKTHSFKASLVIMGLSGIIGQIILLRELLVSFYGNELTLGIILANWLILEAIGSYSAGKSIEKTTKKIEIYGLFQLIFSITFPSALYLSRIFKNIILTVPGEGLGFIPIFYSSFLILLPVSLPHGALFSCGCKLYSEYFRGDGSSIGKVYILETIGTILGGLLITFVLIQYLNPFEIAFAISSTNTLLSVCLLWPGHISPFLRLRNGLWGLSVVFSLLFIYLLIPPTSREINLSSIQSQWKGMGIVHNENSIYGNITVTKREEQFTFFTDGIPSITAPVPDITSVENFVHFSMLFHERPEKILVLSGGSGGMIHEILKYPVTRVDYVELDPLLLELVERFPTPLTQSELSDRRVKIHHRDGRYFIKKTKERFDIILIGLSAPRELQSNRLFTSEFFSIAKQKMNPDGMIALTLPGSLTYISPQLRDLNGCILDTLKSIYRQVRVIPGDVNLFLASNSDKLESVTIGKIVKRLEERKIKVSLFTRGYIEDRLQERWLKWFLESMQDRGLRINSDFHPLAVFYDLAYWNALYSPYLSRIFKWFGGLSLKLAFALATLLTLLIAAIFVKNPGLSRQSLPYALFTSGLTGMIFELAVIFTFQTFYGYLYHQIGLLVAIFMAGIASGSFCVNRRLDRIKRDTLCFLKTELWIILFSFLLPFLFSILPFHLEKATTDLPLYAVFLIVSFISGVSIGVQFPLAAKIYLNIPSKERPFGQVAGLLYGADLFGGFFGGLFGGILLLPILGLKESCFMVAMIKISSFILIVLFTKLQKSTT